MLPEYTSASQLACYSSCPRKFRFKYVEHRPAEFASPSLAVGSAFHGAVAWWFEQKLAGRRPDLHDALRIARADVYAATEGPVRWGQWNRADLAQHAVRLSECFIRAHGELPVAAAEERFEMDLYDPATGEILRRKLLGFLDLVLGDSSVVELKTARSDYKPVDIATSLQFGAYLTAQRRRDVDRPVRLFVVIKNRSPRIQELALRPSAEVERWFLESAAAIEEAITAGIFPPAPSNRCASCEYQRACLGVRAKELGDEEAA